ncbi:MAG: hypothetical protein K1X67_24105 [Fimbriimonadaceae bacterium]|nr:hypothetical protein [Fimbriimonadaceae bacterium]
MSRDSTAQGTDNSTTIKISASWARQTPPDPDAVLFHGTSGRNALAILESGLMPRAMTGSNNFGKQDLSSREDCVYLTDRYHFCHAVHATTHVARESAAAIVEIHLNKLNFKALRPDEDSILTIEERAAGRKWEGESIAERMKHARRSMDANASLWCETLSIFGVIAHVGAIPRRALGRIALFHVPNTLTDLLNPPESDTGAAAALGEYVERLGLPMVRMATRWAFGDDLSTEDAQVLVQSAERAGLIEDSNDPRFLADIRALNEEKRFSVEASASRSRRDWDDLRRFCRPRQRLSAWQPAPY